MNEITHVRAWQRDFNSGTDVWRKELKNILELAQNFGPALDLAVNFYPEGASPTLARKVLNDAIENEFLSISKRM